MKNIRLFVVLSLFLLGAGCFGNGAAPVKPVPVPPPSAGACRNQCGNGVCQEIVCLSTDCPCAESAASCPKDCS